MYLLDGDIGGRGAVDASDVSRGMVDAEECFDVEESLELSAFSSSSVSFGVDWASGITCKRVRLIGNDGGIFVGELKLDGVDCALVSLGKEGKALASSGLGVKVSLTVGEVRDLDDEVKETLF